MITMVQDMSKQPPTQELVAKDLHCVEWRFRHIFRGDLLHSCYHDMAKNQASNIKIYHFFIHWKYRTTKEASIAEWLECVCQCKALSCRRCFHFSKVKWLW